MPIFILAQSGPIWKTMAWKTMAWKTMAWKTMACNYTNNIHETISQF
jgi:hypothetical protein